MLDWDSSLVKQFGFKKGAANVYVIDREGRVVPQITGPFNDATEREIDQKIDRAIAK